MHIWAILLAAGRSSRLAAEGISTPKQFLEVEGRPLFWRSAETFARLAALRGVVFVFPAADDESAALAEATAMLSSLDAGARLGLAWKVTLGGERRQDSVSRALALLPAECDGVLVHDAARPFMSAALAQRVVEGLEQGHPAVIPGLAVTDTVKRVDASERVRETCVREELRTVQTPQGFALGQLRTAHAKAKAEGWEVTDDAALLERCAVPVLVVPGEEENRKITTARDMRLLEALGEKAVKRPCIGFGYDVHKYGGTRPFVLGGVPIHTNIAVAAHSDGDTLLHALMDALLGCIGGGDIGLLFPDTDSAYEGISSGLLLAEVRERTVRAGLELTHVDITVVAQTPRIAPFREAIAKNVASLLHLPVRAVNVKATTEEGLGFTGAKQGIKVMVAATGYLLEPDRE